MGALLGCDPSWWVLGLILFGGSADPGASSSARTLEVTPLVGSASGGLLASGRF